eukprot:4592749-Amphidinium_carterae.1
MDAPDPEARPAGEQDEDRPDDPDAGAEAEVVDYRTPCVPSPSDAETLVLGGPHDQEVEAYERDYLPCAIKLREAPEFMKRDQEVFEYRNMVPVHRSRKAWNMYAMDDAMEVDSNPAPRPPPPAGGMKSKPPPPPPLPPASQLEKKAFETMTKEDRQDYSKLTSLENLTEDDPIPAWALEMDAP